MVSDYVAPATQISELQRIDAASFETFKSRFLRNYRFTSFFTGNIFKEEAEQLVAYLRSNDRSNRVELAKRNFQVVSTRGRSIVVPMVSESADPLDTNGVTMNYYLIGYREEKTRAVVELIRTKFRSEAYEYLRTQKQLGYVVFA
jgi:insulysin